MILYAYLNKDELGEFFGKDSKTNQDQSNDKTHYWLMAEQLDGFLPMAQYLAKNVDNFSDGGLICEFDIPQNLLGENEAIRSIEKNLRTEFLVFYLTMDMINHEWLQDWIEDKNCDMSVDMAYEGLCEKYAVKNPGSLDIWCEKSYS